MEVMCMENTGKFVNINSNPKGKKTTDCVIRALTMATGLTHETVINELVNIYMTKGYFITDKKCYEHWLQFRKYTKHKQPRKADNTKYTGAEFCEYLNKSDIEGTVIAHIGGHHITTFVNVGTTTNKDYKIHDTWDCTNKCVGNYWTQRT